MPLSKSLRSDSRSLDGAFTQSASRRESRRLSLWDRNPSGERVREDSPDRACARAGYPNPRLGGDLFRTLRGGRNRAHEYSPMIFASRPPTLCPSVLSRSIAAGFGPDAPPRFTCESGPFRDPTAWVSPFGRTLRGLGHLLGEARWAHRPVLGRRGDRDGFPRPARFPRCLPRIHKVGFPIRCMPSEQ